MNEQLKKLSEKVEILSKQAQEYSNEIAILKAEIDRLKDENKFAYQPPATKKFITPATIFNLENFVGLKLIHFVGIIVLLIGLSIGVNYAIDANLISPIMRIILAYTAGIILFMLSLRLRKKFFLFSMILFSGAMASAYFTTFAAFEYYSIFSRTVAFLLMLLFTIFTVFNSLKYNREEIAILGLAGAYAIPFFVGDNNGNVAVFFAYMLLINSGILIISFKKYWLPLTYVSFFVTWIIFIAAMFMRFHIGNFWIFNIGGFAFFSLFLFNCLAFKLLKKQPINSSDIFIVVGNSLFLYFALNYVYYEKYNTATTFITLIFTGAYFIGALLVKKLQPLQDHLSNSLFAMSFIALASFVAMEYEGFTVTIIWVLMAVAVFIIGMAWKVKTLRMGSIALFAVTLGKLLLVDSDRFTTIEKVIAYILTGAVLLAVSFLYQKFKQRIFSNSEE